LGILVAGTVHFLSRTIQKCRNSEFIRFFTPLQGRRNQDMNLKLDGSAENPNPMRSEVIEKHHNFLVFRPFIHDCETTVELL
jgi:hypothetical protein